MTAQELLDIMLRQLFAGTLTARTPQEEFTSLGEWKMTVTAWCAVHGVTREHANAEIQSFGMMLIEKQLTDS